MTCNICKKTGHSQDVCWYNKDNREPDEESKQETDTLHAEINREVQHTDGNNRKDYRKEDNTEEGKRNNYERYSKDFEHKRKHRIERGTDTWCNICKKKGHTQNVCWFNTDKIRDTDEESKQINKLQAETEINREVQHTNGNNRKDYQKEDKTRGDERKNYERYSEYTTERGKEIWCSICKEKGHTEKVCWYNTDNSRSTEEEREGKTDTLEISRELQHKNNKNGYQKEDTEYKVERNKDEKHRKDIEYKRRYTIEEGKYIGCNICKKKGHSEKECWYNTNNKREKYREKEKYEDERTGKKVHDIDRNRNTEQNNKTIKKLKRCHQCYNIGHIKRDCWQNEEYKRNNVQDPKNGQMLTQLINMMIKLCQQK